LNSEIKGTNIIPRGANQSLHKFILPNRNIYMDRGIGDDSGRYWFVKVEKTHQNNVTHEAKVSRDYYS
jgi:hypothetical protein